MSNQRPGKTHRAAASDGLGDMKLLQSFRELRATVMKSVDNEEVEWVISAIVEELTAGRSLPSDVRGWEKVLGL